MSRKDIVAIFEKAQRGSSCHPKSILALMKIYNKTPFDEFVGEFMRILRNIFHVSIIKKNPFAERSLDFAANFTGKLVNQAAAEITDANIEDLETHPFLHHIISEVLRYHDLELPSARYHSCQFIALVLKHTGDNVHLNADICDTIQNAMLERIADCLSMVRIQAVTALLRLQDPSNNDCPVIHAYIVHLNDVNSRVRREVVERIAPAIVAIPKIVERVRDVDALVRMAVFHKCAVIGPAFLKITDRQTILTCGFQEENVIAKKAFFQVLLPKWITSYNGNFLKFINAIKLDADETDIKNWMSLSKNIMIEILKEYPINDIIEFLPLNDDKLIPLDKLTSESVSYWCILYDLLMKNSDLEDFVEQIVPELTHFSNYIDKFIKEKQNKLMEEWQYIEYQCILNLLLNMANNFDLSDEVGRINLQKVITNILIHNKAQFENVYTMVEILSKLITEPSELTKMMCHTISEIRELFVEPSEPIIGPESEYLIAGLKVKLNIATDEMETAVRNSNFLLAKQKKLELETLRDKIDEILQETVATKVVQEDPDTICRYLNIIIALLQLPCIKQVDPSLQTCKDEVLLPLADSGNSEIFWRVHKCIGLYCLLDEDLAKENFKTICTPLIMYRMLPNYNKSVLLTSVGLFSDLLRMFGSKIIGEDANSTFQKKNVRRLYQQNDVSDFDVQDLNSISCEEIIDIIVDILEDDCQEVRECAGNSLSKLIIAGLLNSPTLISRIILKWFNPITEKNDQNLQQTFGICIKMYAENVTGSEDVLEKAIIPTLNAVANAPPTSPLADISIDNLVKFLAAITSIPKKNQIVDSHKNIAISLCSQLAKKPDHKCNDIWARMLVNLNIPYKDSAAMVELVKEVELLLENVHDKNPRRYLERYLVNLKEKLKLIENSNVALDSIAEETNISNTDETVEKTVEGQSGPKITVQQVVIYNGKQTEIAFGNIQKEDGEPEVKKKKLDVEDKEKPEVKKKRLDMEDKDKAGKDQREESSDSRDEDHEESDKEKENNENTIIKEKTPDKEQEGEHLEKSLNSSQTSRNTSNILDSSIEGSEGNGNKNDDSVCTNSSTKSKRGRKKKVPPEIDLKTTIDARKSLQSADVGRRSNRIAYRTDSHSSSDKTKNNEKENKRITGRLSSRESVDSKAESTTTNRLSNNRSSDRISSRVSSSSRSLGGDVADVESLMNSSSHTTRKSLRREKKIDYSDNVKVILNRLDTEEIIKNKAKGINNNIANKNKIQNVLDNKSDSENKQNTKKNQIPDSPVSTRSRSVITVSSGTTKSSKNNIVPVRVSVRSKNTAGRRRYEQISETDSSTEKEETTNINNKRETTKKSKKKGKKTKMDLNSSIDSLNSSPLREVRRSLRSISSLSDRSHNRSLPSKRKKGNKSVNYSMMSSKSEGTILHTFLQDDEFVCERVEESVLMSSESDTQSEVPMRKKRFQRS